MSKLILGYILYYSAQFGVDPNIVKAVVQIESRGSPSLVGEAGEVGLMQLLPSSFPNHKRRQLKDTRTNIALGVQYLAEVKKKCSHQADLTWIVCYNAGVRGGRRIKSPKQFRYYVDFMREYERLSQNVENLPIQDGVRKR